MAVWLVCDGTRHLLAYLVVIAGMSGSKKRAPLDAQHPHHYESKTTRFFECNVRETRNSIGEAIDMMIPWMMSGCSVQSFEGEPRSGLARGPPLPMLRADASES